MLSLFRRLSRADVRHEWQEEDLLPSQGNVMQIFRNGYLVNIHAFGMDFTVLLPTSQRPFVLGNADERVLTAFRDHINDWSQQYIRQHFGLRPDPEEEQAAAFGLADRLRRLHGFANPLIDMVILRAMRQREAHKRAEETLRRHLNNEQWRNYCFQNYFDICTPSNRRYRLHKVSSRGIQRLPTGPCYCIVFDYPDIPLPDLLLAQKLLLEADEDRVLRIAQSDPFLQYPAPPYDAVRARMGGVY